MAVQHGFHLHRISRPITDQLFFFFLSESVSARAFLRVRVPTLWRLRDSFASEEVDRAVSFFTAGDVGTEGRDGGTKGRDGGIRGLGPPERM
jgi:hypothetical protein